MNVLHLISSEGYYGAENMLVTLATHLNRLGCRSTIAAFRHRARPHTEICERAEAQGVESVTILCRGRADRRAVKAIRKCVEAHKIDLLHTHGYKADVYGYAAVHSGHIPVVATCHNWPDRTGVLGFYSVLDRLILHWFDRVVAVSGGVAAHLKRYGVTGDKIAVIYNGIDVPRFSGARPTLAQDVQKGSKKIVGMVARLVAGKGCDYLLKAIPGVVKAFPDTLFAIVGSGPAERELKALALQLGIERHVIFAGPRGDMPGVYASLDVFILPSLDEGTPISILEAMAAGKPVIATRVGGIPKIIVPDQTGLLIEARDSSAIRNAIVRVLESPDFASKLGDRARAWVAERFAAEAMAQQYFDLYRQLTPAKAIVGQEGEMVLQNLGRGRSGH